MHGLDFSALVTIIIGVFSALLFAPLVALAVAIVARK